jgi:excisionase family DNA binding protein
MFKYILNVYHVTNKKILKKYLMGVWPMAKRAAKAGTSRNDADDTFKLYGVGDVAQHLEISKQLVYRYLKSGELKGKRIGRSWRITPEHVREFLNN